MGTILIKYSILKRSQFHNYCLDKFYGTFLLNVSMTFTLQDTQHNDTQHNDTQHNDTQQSNKIVAHNVKLIFMAMVVMVKPTMLSVITMGVVRPIVVALISEPSTTATTTRC